MAATGVHGLLLLVLVVAPALTKAPEQPAPGSVAPVMEFIPAPKSLAARAAASAVEPVPPTKQEEVTPAAPPPSPPPPPPPSPPEPPPTKVEPVKEVEIKSPIVVKTPVKDAELPAVKKTESKPPKKEPPKKEPPKKEVAKKEPPKKETAKTKEPEPPKVAPKKAEPPKIKIADTEHPVKRTSDESAKKAAAAADAAAAAKAKASAAATAKANAERVAQVNGVIGGVKGNLSESVNIEAVGAGAAQFATYGQTVVAIYERNWLNKPEDVTEDNVIVHVSVTITRDGFVKDAHIVRPSGKGSVDRSVKQTLERVRDMPPFPPGATDAERTFNIDFNLKTSKRIG